MNQAKDKAGRRFRLLDALFLAMTLAPPLLGMAVLLLLLGMAVRGTCRRCLMILLFLLALAAFPHRDLTMFALGGLAVWCLMPGRDSGKKGRLRLFYDDSFRQPL